MNKIFWIIESNNTLFSLFFTRILFDKLSVTEILLSLVIASWYITTPFLSWNWVVIYQDSIMKDKRVAVTDNLPNNVLVKNNEKKLLLDSIIQNILFKSKVSLN